MTLQPTRDQVLVEMSGMLSEIFAELGPCPVEITRDTLFLHDLDLESIDLVTLAGMLYARWGQQINLAEFIAGKKLPELMNLTVGQLADHVADRLVTAETILL
jgi:acyl carrier protein